MYVRYSYPIIHWIITVLVGPFLWAVYLLASSNSGYDDFGGLWLAAVLLGAFMSLPVLGLYLLLFRFVRDASMPELLLKCLMDILIVGLAWITLAWQGGTMVPELFVSYALAIILSSMAIKFRKDEKQLPPQP